MTTSATTRPPRAQPPPPHGRRGLAAEEKKDGVAGGGRRVAAPTTAASHTPIGGDRKKDELLLRLMHEDQSPDGLENLSSLSMFQKPRVTDESDKWDMVSGTDKSEEKAKMEENKEWDLVSGTDKGEEKAKMEEIKDSLDDYVLVKDEDVVDGMATFMATYLTSMKEYKELTPDQLQKALQKTLGKKKKGKIRKAWEGSKVAYNVASWSFTAVGMCQNPAVFSAASAALWSSCRAISKLF